MKNKCLWVLLLCLCVGTHIPTMAQEEYLMEIGAGGGIGFYMGDANTTRFYKNSEMAFSLLWSYRFNPRYGVKVGLNESRLSGDTQHGSNYFPEERTFRSARIFMISQEGLNTTSTLTAIA